MFNFFFVTNFFFFVKKTVRMRTIPWDFEENHAIALVYLIQGKNNILEIIFLFLFFFFYTGSLEGFVSCRICEVISGSNYRYNHDGTPYLSGRAWFSCNLFNIYFFFKRIILFFLLLLFYVIFSFERT